MYYAETYKLSVIEHATAGTSSHPIAEILQPAFNKTEDLIE
jgi:hypothetical protein